MRWFVLAALVACTGVQPRFPADVETALAHDSMRTLETERFLIYYPARRRAEVDRFLAHADRCAEALRDQAHEKHLDKMVVVMPDLAFNNAFVLPDALGSEAVSVIPLQATLDFATEFGLPPDPGYVACHELTHYVHLQQVTGFWHYLDSVLGHLYTPQIGYDPWFLEGLATHYETVLQPGVGRPSWPIFTGMFAAAYADQHVGGGDMSSLGRQASVGHHYLVGTMFVRFLTERYGERPLWNAIAEESHALTGWFFTGTFDQFGASFGTLLDQFDAWVHQTFRVRTPPPDQRDLGAIGNDARYARGRDGTEAWVSNDVDVPPRLTVRASDGTTLASIALSQIIPPRTLITGEPLLTSGLSITDAGDVYLTAIDLGPTFQIPRLLRWTRATGLTEIASDLGPGAAISPDGSTYYFCAVDGDRWSLAAYDLAHRTRHLLVDMPPGSYVLGGQVSPDGQRLALSVFDHAFQIWVVDAHTGVLAQRITRSPSYDPSFTPDGRLLYLSSIENRFQIFLDDIPISDVPYAPLNARATSTTIRFLDREHWSWRLAEIPLPAPPPIPNSEFSVPYSLFPADPAPPSAAVPILSDTSYSLLDHLFFPQQRSPTLLAAGHGSPFFGLVLGGADRLNLQRWNIAGYLQPKSADIPQRHYGLAVSYVNALLAPVELIASFSRLDWGDPTPDTVDPMIKHDIERRTRDASLLAQHTYRGTLTTTLGGVYTDDRTIDDTGMETRRRLGGPALALSWTSAETTRYTGLRRALLADTAVARYPHQLSSFASDITDVGATLGTVLPLPVGRRHTIRASIRGRALVSSQDTGLLQLGGDSGLATLWNGSSSSTTPPAYDDTRFPPNLRFVEPLRGYEDYAITTDRAAIANVSWRYPIIIDRGVAATLWVLPASFLRELDLELFGAGALDRAGNQHAAAGGAITLRLQLLRIPFLVTYQLARRVADDRAITQLVGLAPDL